MMKKNDIKVGDIITINDDICKLKGEAEIVEIKEDGGLVLKGIGDLKNYTGYFNRLSE